MTPKSLVTVSVFPAVTLFLGATFAAVCASTALAPSAGWARVLGSALDNRRPLRNAIFCATVLAIMLGATANMFSCEGHILLSEHLNKTSVDLNTSVCTHPQLDPDDGGLRLLPESALFVETWLAALHAFHLPSADACHFFRMSSKELVSGNLAFLLNFVLLFSSPYSSTWLATIADCTYVEQLLNGQTFHSLPPIKSFLRMSSSIMSINLLSSIAEGRPSTRLSSPLGNFWNKC
ncbi:uncharacterized protein CEXT_679681 [Caerostris extrusa]|uniref:Uncharacterized protein n=1 Tax=Caerostris extrusa TaxID=172846 RepID=A0AAV4NVK9_CAEEX|nr:uncharacterized protein CEXT_679681 [Caerostris extrusa]